jgi:hypothetical protein
MNARTMSQIQENRFMSGVPPLEVVAGTAAHAADCRLRMMRLPVKTASYFGLAKSQGHRPCICHPSRRDNGQAGLDGQKRQRGGEKGP